MSLRWNRGWPVFAAWLLTAAWGGGRSEAQTVSAVPPPAASLELREAQYRQLARDVAELDRQLGIYKRVAALTAPSVVHIQAAPKPEFQFRRDVEEAGAGVLVRYAGRDYILTNRHVVRHSDPARIRIELDDGRELTPASLLSDKETDVAVLEVAAEDLVPARIGDSNLAEIGDIVLAFGSPFNLRHSVTRGIISAKGRSNLDLGDGEVAYQNFLQTDAAINPGNSGGPLVNIRGEVVGLNTAIASNSGGNEGIGFSIPINIAMSVMRQLIEHGRVERGFLGVTLDGYFDARAARLVGLTRPAGARVKAVAQQSPAATAGLQVDDVILRFDGAAVDDDDHLHSLVRLAEQGQQVDLVVLRGGRTQALRVRLGRQADDPQYAGAGR